MKTTGIVLTALVATAVWASYRAFANNGTQGADLALAPAADVVEAASRLVARDRFPSLDGATGWINTPPLSALVAPSLPGTQGEEASAAERERRAAGGKR